MIACTCNPNHFGNRGRGNCSSLEVQASLGNIGRPHLKKKGRKRARVGRKEGRENTCIFIAKINIFPVLTYFCV
jgi:hypothetical protein